MKSRFIPGRSTQLLIAAILTMTLIIIVEILFPAGPNLAAAEASDSESMALPSFDREALSPPALGALTDMAARPLFFTERRMPEPEKAEPPPPPTPLRLRLIGVAISGGSKVVLVRNLVNNQLLQLAEGDTHDGWTMDSLGAQSATFSRGAQTTELPLEQVDGRRSR